MNSFVRFVRNWMLPLAMTAGIGTYLAVRFVPALQPGEPVLIKVARDIQPVFVTMMLFLQFVKVSPHDLKPHRWHLALLLVQTLSFLLLGVLALRLPEGAPRILTEAVMLCLICPTAAAAGVITHRLGGSLSAVMSYTALINCAAAVVIPIMAPLLHPAADGSFLTDFTRIIIRAFSILILPCAAAWTVRYTTHRLQRFLMRYTGLAFYLWAVSLALALSLAVKSLIDSHISLGLTLAIAAVSLIACLLQFGIGRWSARKHGPGEALSAGQAMGQKNTGFFIWLAYSFFNPVTSIAGGFYAIWHNVVNSWELYQKQRTR